MRPVGFFAGVFLDRLRRRCGRRGRRPPEQLREQRHGELRLGRGEPLGLLPEEPELELAALLEQPEVELMVVLALRGEPRVLRAEVADLRRGFSGGSSVIHPAAGW